MPHINIACTCTYLACMHVRTYSDMQAIRSLPCTWSGGSSECVGDLVHVSHNLLPGLVHLGEHLGLVGQLSLDVGSTEDALQVQPISLAFHPLILTIHAIQRCTYWKLHNMHYKRCTYILEATIHTCTYVRTVCMCAHT